MVTGLASRFVEIRDSLGALCVGIDPHEQILAEWGLPVSAAGVRDFGLLAIDACAGEVGIVKPQVAFFERFGSAGFAALEDVILAAHDAGIAVIADAKRGDVGSTVDAYSRAWLGEGSLQSEAVTANPYQGLGSLSPMIDRAEESGAVVFVLAATSNPEGVAQQQAQLGETSVANSIAQQAVARNAGSVPGPVGLVIGATVSLTDFDIDPASLAGTLILAPGFGYQGAVLRDIAAIYGDLAPWVIPSVSRSVLAGDPITMRDRVRSARDEAALS
ncbi:MAG: orotidine-5'-phosphate decarboxylase [Microbacteriaceae bacterium]